MSLGSAASGAASGAAIGSFGGPIGTGIGAGVGGLIGLFKGGKKTTTDPTDPNDELSTIMAQLKDSGSALKTKAADLSNVGMAQIQPVLDYFKKLVGGDESALLDATKPERGRVIDQYDTARKAISTFSPRGGGTNAALAGSQFQEADTLSKITADARTNALNQSSQLGMALQGLGLSADQLASQDLGTILQTVLAKKGLDLQSRGQNMEALAGLGEALGTIIAAKYGAGK